MLSVETIPFFGKRCHLQQESSPRQCRLEMASGGEHRGGGEGRHVKVSHREGHSALHLLGCALVSGLEALHVQAQHRRQLPDGHLLACTARALAPAGKQAKVGDLRISMPDGRRSDRYGDSAD